MIITTSNILYNVSFSGIVKSTQVLVSGPNIENLERWRVLGATVTDENGEVSTRYNNAHYIAQFF